MSDVVVRDALPGDAEELARLHVRAWQEGYAGLMPQAYLDDLQAEPRLEFWTRELAAPSGSVLLALDDERLVAFAAAGPARDQAHTGSSELYALYVLSAYWGSGLADRLLDAVLAQWPDPVLLWVLETNGRARAFYERHGFEPDGARTETDRGGVMLGEVRYRRGPVESGGPELKT